MRPSPTRTKQKAIVPLTQAPYQGHFRVGYTGGTLGSLDILDALGTYDFTGLTVFGYNLWTGSPDNVVLDIEFTHMTITPAPATLLAFAPLILGLRRRRRD